MRVRVRPQARTSPHQHPEGSWSRHSSLLSLDQIPILLHMKSDAASLPPTAHLSTPGGDFHGNGAAVVEEKGGGRGHGGRQMNLH